MPSIKISELISTDDSGYSSDSDQEDAKNTKYLPQQDSGAKTGGDLAAIIQEINQTLENDDEVDFNKYPPLFIVQYRGTHYFSRIFDSKKRAESRHKIKQKEKPESIYSYAIYDLAGLELGEPIDTDEKKQKIRAAKLILQKDFDQLRGSNPTGASWFGNKRGYNNLLYLHYQRYVNNYKEFRQESQSKIYSCYTLMSTDKTPYISTADDAKHAVEYALGGKAELVHGVMRPGYDSASGRPKHPKVGYVQIIFHTLQDIARKNPLFLSTLQAEGRIDIKDRNLNERETTYFGYITSKHIVATEVMRFPSFNVKYNANFHKNKYGIDVPGSFTKYRDSLKNIKKDAGTGLIDKLAEHYAGKLNETAGKIAQEKRGFIVYLGLDGRLRATLPTTTDIRTERSQKTLSKQSFFSDNLGRFNTNPDDETDSDEEFPFLKASGEISKSAIPQVVKKNNGMSSGRNDQKFLYFEVDDNDYLGINGDNLEYLYSLDDGYRLLLAIRQEKLRYINLVPANDPFNCLRENTNGIFISDPYNYPFGSYFWDDILGVTGTHDIPARNNQCWHNMPTKIIIPFLSGGHWRSIRIEISYFLQRVDILWDDPFGGNAFSPELVNRILPMLKKGLTHLFRKQLNNPDYQLSDINIHQQYKGKDQQGRGINGVDCGPIVFSNVRDYTQTIANASFVAIDTPHYAITASVDDGHSDLIEEVRLQDARMYDTFQDVAPEPLQRIQEINQDIQQQKQKNFEHINGELTLVSKNITKNLNPKEISMLFDYIENQRALSGIDVSALYQESELEAGYNAILKLRKSSLSIEEEGLLSQKFQAKILIKQSEFFSAPTEVPKPRKDCFCLSENDFKSLEGWYSSYYDDPERQAVVIDYERRYGADTFGIDYCLAYNSRKGRLCGLGCGEEGNLNLSLYNKIVDFVNNVPMSKPSSFDLKSVAIVTYLPTFDCGDVHQWYEDIYNSQKMNEQDIVNAYEKLYGDDSFGVDACIAYNMENNNLRDISDHEVSNMLIHLHEKIFNFIQWQKGPVNRMGKNI